MEKKKYLNCVSLILCRGSSKSIPNKNRKSFNGSPLIVHVLEQIVTKCNFFSSFWVSTDDESTIEVINKHFTSKSGSKQINIHTRTKVTARDTSSSISAVQEFLNCHNNQDWDAISLIQITSPLQSEVYLREAFEKMNNNSNIESVFSVFIDKSLRWSRTRLEPINFDPKQRPRRQDWDGEYVESGHFYFATIDLLKRGLFQSPNNGDVVVIPPEYCIELDYPYQWPIAEFMDEQLKQQLRQK